MNNPFETHGAFSWCELMTDDVDAAAAFYSTVYGWEVEDFQMPDFTYKIVKAGGESVGGIMPKNQAGPEVPTAWVSYITVNDVDAVAESVTANGGQVIIPPFDIPNVGRACHLVDPTGGVVAMISYPVPEQA